MTYLFADVSLSGNPIASSTPSQVLYADNSGNLFSDANFTRDSVTGVTNIKTNVIAGNTTQLQIDNGISFSFNNGSATSSYTFPVTNGVGQLTNNGSGVLSWQSNANGFNLDTHENMFAGTGTGNSSATGSDNLFIGIRTGTNISSGTNNIAFGLSALGGATTGYENTAIGTFSLSNNTEGYQNTANGGSALYKNSLGNQNTAIGNDSLHKNTTGSYNTAIGFETLYYNTIGDYNTALGFEANVASNSLTNATAIGALSAVGASNSLVLGSINGVNGATSSTNVGIGTSTPQYALDVLASGTGVIARFNSTNSTGCTLGTDGTMTCTSDARLKKNVVSLGTELDSLMNLRPVEYNWNYENDSQMKSLGFIAQEVESIFPKLVVTDSNGFKELNTIGLTPIMVKSIQELNLKITNMATEVDTGKVCLKKFDGTNVCLDGDQLDQILNSTSQNSPIETPTPTSTDSTVNQTATSTDPVSIDTTQIINTDSSSTSTDQAAE